MTDDLLQRLREYTDTAPKWMRDTFHQAAEEIERLDAAEDELRARAESAERERDALRERIAKARPLFSRYDKRLESPAAGFTGTIAIRVEDYERIRAMVVEDGGK